MQEYEDEGISLGQIFKVIFRRWKLLLFITGVIFVFGLLGSQLVYNKLKTDYTTSVEYVGIGVESGYYRDNSQFNYRDLVKLESLQAVKDSNPDYSSIDVKTLVDKEKISIKKELVQDDTKTTTYTQYTLTVSSRYFKSAEQAKDFMHDVLYVPVTKTIQIEDDKNHSTALDSYEQSYVYEEQVAYLKNQLAYLDQKYAELITSFGDIPVTLTIDGTKYVKMISEYKQVLDTYFDQHKFSELDNILTAYKYVKNFDVNRTKLEIRKEALEKQIEDNNKIIEKLYEQMVTLNNGNPVTIDAVQSTEAFTPFTSQIASLTSSNAQMENEVKDITEQLEVEGGDPVKRADFESKMNVYYEKLVKETEIFRDCSKNVITEKAGLEYTGKAIEAKGGLSLLIAVLLFLVGGFVVAAIVNLIIDRKYLKEDNVAPAYAGNAKHRIATVEEPKVEEAKAPETEEPKKEE